MAAKARNRPAPDRGAPVRPAPGPGKLASKRARGQTSSEPAVLEALADIVRGLASLQAEVTSLKAEVTSLKAEATSLKTSASPEQIQKSIQEQIDAVVADLRDGYMGAWTERAGPPAGLLQPGKYVGHNIGGPRREFPRQSGYGIDEE